MVFSAVTSWQDSYMTLKVNLVLGTWKCPAIWKLWLWSFLSCLWFMVWCFDVTNKILQSTDGTKNICWEATKFEKIFYLVLNQRRTEEKRQVPLKLQKFKKFKIQFAYSEVPNRRADRNKRAGLEKSVKLLAYLISKLINEQGGIFRLLHEKL